MEASIKDSTDRKSRLIALFSFIVLLSFDQISKFWARNFLANNGSVPFIDEILEFRYAENTGVAFSMFNEYPILLTILVAAINLVIFAYLSSLKKIPAYWVFIAAGALGNLLDRVSYGFVTDFINPLFIDFAIFNLADAFLNIGLGLYIINCFTSKND